MEAEDTPITECADTAPARSPAALLWDAFPEKKSWDEYIAWYFEEHQYPLISIIMPTYNRGHLLVEAVESCLSQTYPNFELIIVDDGSEDNTGEICLWFETNDPRVRSIRQENQKLPRALNAGLAAAKGKLITWTSDDNRYDPEAIEIMYQYLWAHNDAGVVYCDMRKMGPDEEDLGMYEHLADPEMLIERECIGGCFLFHREVYEKIGGYDPDLFLAEDYDFWVRAHFYFPIHRLRGVAPYRYMVHPDSLSSSRDIECHLQMRRVQWKNYYKAAPMLHFKQMEAYCELAEWYSDAGNYEQALRYLGKCIRLCPTEKTLWQRAWDAWKAQRAEKRRPRPFPRAQNVIGG